MGGMYNAIFGMNHMSDLVLATLGLDRASFGRFRDVHVGNGEIAVYTRCGGGNRESYQSMFDRMVEHPNYLRNQDDDFDCTYATVFFSFPAGFAEELAKFDKGEPFDPDHKWQRAFEALRNAVPPKV